MKTHYHNEPRSRAKTDRRPLQAGALPNRRRRRVGHSAKHTDAVGARQKNSPRVRSKGPAGKTGRHSLKVAVTGAFLKKATDFGASPQDLMEAVIRNEVSGKVKLLDFTASDHKVIRRLRTWEKAIKKLIAAI